MMNTSPRYSYGSSDGSYAGTRVPSNQGRSYLRIRRINDTGPPYDRGPNMCDYNPLSRLPYLKKGLERILILGRLRASYASASNYIQHILIHAVSSSHS
ncbi:hypothetical protein TNCV_4987821 [Trichonephila clavipes]|nr:hypothetical protein TNCV_4987821 [Trichonephila clavipes]